MTNVLTRRQFLGRAAAVAALPHVWPGLTLAGTTNDARLVIVLLRGALDGLAAVAPYGDGRYLELRGPLALPAPGAEHGVLKLDGLFGLHPALERLYAWYRNRELAVVHAVASPYRERSHFDGQNLLENGTDRPFGASSGWLNRALAHVPAAAGREYGIALGQNVPLILRGPEPVGSWAPSILPGVSDETIDRIVDLYAPDAFFSTRLAHALETDALAPSSNGHGRLGPQQFMEMCRAAGAFLANPQGPRVAVLESTGWDTHANQGAHAGHLATRLGFLDRGLAGLRPELAGAWDQTVVVVVSEFGRTAAVNGTGGTDHGTAGALLLAGGAVNGGRVLGDWPGLASRDLHEGRDLMPTTDLRSVLKSVLAEHVGLGEDTLESAVFPDSLDARPLSGLVRPA